jgi:hypothetical protein
MSVGLGPYIWQGIELQSWRVNPGQDVEDCGPSVLAWMLRL